MASTPKFRHIPGYSAVDHFGPEIVSACEEAAAGKSYATRGGARKAGERIVARVKRDYRPCHNYSGPSLWSIRIDVDA